MDNPILQSALDCAAQGLRVFPCHSILDSYFILTDSQPCSCNGKTPGCKPGKHPRIKAWQHKATTDPDVITKWWKKKGWSDANIGVLPISFGYVVEIDPRRGGIETLAKLEAEYGELPRDWVVQSGGTDEGIHIYLSVPDGIQVKSCERWKEQGVEIIGVGAYVIAPPSKHLSGNSYKWKSKNGSKPPMSPTGWMDVVPTIAADKPPLDEWFSGQRDEQSSQCTDKADNPHTYSVLSALSALSVHDDTKARLVDLIHSTVPTVNGIRNKKLIQFARGLLRVEEVRDWDAEEFEPIIKAWLELALQYIGARDWNETWNEWLYIWGVWLDRSDKYLKIDKANEVAMQNPFPPMPDNYKSKHLRQLVALCAAIHETAADADGVWFISCRDAAAVLGLVAKRGDTLETQHELAASFLRRLVADGILEKAGEHKQGSMKAQRYRYLGYTEAKAAA